MEYKNWIKKAEEDLDTAIYNLKGDKIEAGLFFLQQSAEKALKAVYIKKFKKLLKTHDLVRLSREVKAPENIEEICKELTRVYQYTRYPDAKIDSEVTAEEIEKFKQGVEEIIKWIKKQ
jgi:HEPN domain-containing protein